MKKLLGVLLVLALPLSANAANICLRDSATGNIMKFKKPSVGKLGAAAIAGTFIVPAASDTDPDPEYDNGHPQFVGYVEGNVVALGDKTLSYNILGGVFFTAEYAAAHEAGYEGGYGIYHVTNADAKTYVGSAMSFSDGGVPASLVAIDCKTVPVY